ncbi:uncharacterized protein LOC143909806 [Arctopsyche grandis]|uniref:uncharacterized protein LOC143909806 n=1 Tax=Arctopsyche grandis TaxID=121162 RepID=UPI00406D9489
MSSRRVDFVKLWKEQVFDVACEKSLDLVKNYKDPQSKNISVEATSQKRLEKTKDDKEESLRETSIASNDDDDKLTDPFLDNGDGKRANDDAVQNESDCEDISELKENKGKMSASANINVVRDESVDAAKIKPKKKIPKTCCQQVRKSFANFGLGWCICTTITSCLCCGLCMVPLFFLGRCLCCNCPSFDSDNDDDDEKCAEGEKTKGVKPDCSVEDAEKEKDPKVITEAPSGNLKPILEEVDSEINVKSEEEISGKP